MSEQRTNNSVLAVEVSYFRNYRSSTEPVTVNLLNILRSTKHKSQVEEIRKIHCKEERDDKKSMLPAFTPSGVFGTRSDAGLIKHSGLIGIDIDFKDNQKVPNYGELKKELIKIRHVAYCGLSVSGTGYFCLVVIAYPDRHRQQFNALARKFEEHGIQIDKRCINVSRLRGVSYDPEAYFNHDAVPCTACDEPEQRTNRQYLLNTIKNEEEVKVERLVQAIEQNKIDITTSYEAWFPIGCSLANSLGENGRDYYHRLSQFHPKYTYRRADYEYDKCLKKRHMYNYSLRTLFYHCKQAGIRV